jgi:hypothetical protein
MCTENREKDGGIEAKLGFGGSAEASYKLGGVGGFIRCVDLPAVDPVPGSAPPSCFLPEEDNDRTGKLGRADVGLAGGLQFGFSLLFFCALSFL